MRPFLLAGAVGTTIFERMWDGFLEMVTGRMQSSAPTTVTLLQQAEKVFLGPTDDLTLHPAVQDVFYAMRVGGLILLAFCTVISLAEQAEAGITGSGGNLVGWFKRFFVATLLTFGGLQFYGLWIRLFNGVLSLFRGYLDTHWNGANDVGFIYTMLMRFFSEANTLLVLALAGLTLITLFLLWFLVGGVRQAELILSIVIAPIVWPLYLIPSVEDIPKTAFRGFLGLNAVLLFSVAMVRMALRLAIGAEGIVQIWNLVPAIAMLVFTIFLPATIKRIVGQGQSGVGALMTALQVATSLKFLALKPAAGAVAPPAAAAIPTQAPAGASAYPLATVPSSGVTGCSGAQGQAAPARAARAFVEGAAQARPAGLPEPFKASQACIDMGEAVPGSGKFNVVLAMKKFQEGVDAVKGPAEQEDGGGV